MSYTHETRVLGGLPVTVGFNIQPAEPDVGIFSAYVDEWWIEEVNGRPIKKDDWIRNRIKPGEEAALLEELAEQAGEDDYYEDY